MNKAECAFQAEEFRSRFGIDNLAPIDIFALAKRIPNMTTVLYPLGENISGMSVKDPKFKLAAINSSQTYGRQRFTLAHELFHLFYDKEMDGTVICPSKVTSQSNVEKQADAFASYLLLPRLALKQEISKERPSAKQPTEETLRWLFRLEQRYEVSRACLLVRLEDEGVLSKDESLAFKSNIKNNARKLGFPTLLYERSSGSAAKCADGGYVSLISTLLGSDIISRGKAKEYLTDGFRDDIFVIELEEDDVYD